MLPTDFILIGSQAGTHSIYTMEQRFNSFFENKMLSIGMCNATMALISVFVSLELKPGDKILTTPYTWGGTISGALFMGLSIVFADIDPHTLTLSPASVKNQLVKNKDIKVILDVDIFGNPSLSVEINQIAKEYKCFHLIDSASGFGSRYKGKPSGFYADAVVYSFSESKGINIGEGAVLLVQDSEFFEKLVFYTQHPNRAKRDAPIYAQNQFALNFRIHPFAAYYLNENFDISLSKINQNREDIIDFLRSLETYSGIRLVNKSFVDYTPSFTRVCFKLSKGPLQVLYHFVNESDKKIQIEQPSINKLLFNDPVLYELGYHRQLQYDNSIKVAPEHILNSYELNFNF